MYLQDDQQLKNLIVLDIETVSTHEDFEQLDERIKEQWTKKASYLHNEDELSVEELYFRRAAIYAEFGKIISIALGFFVRDDNKTLNLRIKSFASDDEKELLTNFKNLLENKFDQKELTLVAHNGKEFDFPYLCRRMLINGIMIPDSLDMSGKKPWEVNHIDTLEMWKFGDRKNYTSLDLLAAIFNIHSSKDDIDGSQVNHVYYKEKDLKRIASYCERDVMVTAQLFLRLNCMEPVADQNIHFL